MDDFFESSYKITKAAVADRLRTILSSSTSQGVLIGKNTVDLPGLMDSGKFCVFKLSAGGIGQDTSPALGRLILCAIQGAAMRRQEIEEGKRKPVFLFIDEANRFISDAVVEIYNETRKFGLHLCLVQQITGFNMAPDTYRAIVGNSRVKFAGASGDPDTLKDLSQMTFAEKEEIRKLKPLSFYMKSTTSDNPIKFELNRKLLRDSYSMTHDEWSKVKDFQIKKYYQNGNKSTPDSVSITDEPIDFEY
jgi:type IV secretory pathway TraG/TraD family ATPase VirD4